MVQVGFRELVDWLLARFGCVVGRCAQGGPVCQGARHQTAVRTRRVVDARIKWLPVRIANFNIYVCSMF